MEYLVIWALIAANLVGFALCGIDKRRAKRHAWRVPEKVLFGAAFLGGGFGIWAGMYAFHHKTKHWYFVIGIPLITLVEYGLLRGLLAR